MVSSGGSGVISWPYRIIAHNYNSIVGKINIGDQDYNTIHCIVWHYAKDRLAVSLFYFINHTLI